MNFIKRIFSIFFMLVLYLFPASSVAQDSLFIIPKPLLQVAGAGYYLYPEESTVFASQPFLAATALLKEHPYLKFKKVRTLGLGKKVPKQGIILRKASEKDSLAANAYRLEVTPDRIVITAHQPEAIMNGIATLRQLAYTRRNGRQVPSVSITDQPAFAYRGLMLDVSRHFLPIAFVKKYVDLMSLYKLNTLHWHLTDGAGWRLQIKKYPELTEKAAWRTGASYKAWRKNGGKYALMGTPEASGGFYSADEARDLVKYAATRGINVIPEIEMPGHSEEVLATYPNLSCYSLPYQNSEFCIGNEDTFVFLENVLDEVIDIFPSLYVHVGGDEANKSAWKTCPKCQKLIHDANLKDESGLQSYAVKRLETYLSSKGRKLIGWDEILEGGLAPSATVMSWRGEKGGIEAANSGHDVIMTPETYLYFDAYQTNPIGQPEAIGGYLPIQRVYGYHPIPAEIDADKRKHVLGLQANVWAEYMPTSNQVEYMVFPRALALAEVGWTAEKNKEWADFQGRLQKQYLLLQRFSVNYYPPSSELSILSKFDPFKRMSSVSISSEYFKPQIRYTIDGSMPTPASSLYEAPISLSSTALVKAAIFDGQVQKGKLQELCVDLHKAIGKKVIYNNKWSDKYPAQGEQTLVNGQSGDLTYHDGQWQGFLSDFDVTIDLDNKEALTELKVRFMQLTGPGVYLPSEVCLAVSEDGQTFTDVRKAANDVPDTDATLRFKTFEFDLQGITSRFIRVIGKNLKKQFMFCDEVVIY